MNRTHWDTFGSCFHAPRWCSKWINCLRLAAHVNRRAKLLFWACNNTQWKLIHWKSPPPGMTTGSFDKYRVNTEEEQEWRLPSGFSRPTHQGICASGWRKKRSCILSPSPLWDHNANPKTWVRSSRWGMHAWLLMLKWARQEHSPSETSAVLTISRLKSWSSKSRFQTFHTKLMCVPVHYIVQTVRYTLSKRLLT